MGLPVMTALAFQQRSRDRLRNIDGRRAAPFQAWSIEILQRTRSFW